MVVRTIIWEQIKDKFSEEEKEELRDVFVGEVICPKGWHISEQSLPKYLREKLIKLIGGA